MDGGLLLFHGLFPFCQLNYTVFLALVQALYMACFNKVILVTMRKVRYTFTVGTEKQCAGVRTQDPKEIRGRYTLWKNH